VLRIYQSTTASDAKRYFTEGLATEDYYTKDREIAGYWGGRAAERLGLIGPVDRVPFARLCENFHPQSGDRLTPRTRDDRTVGYDVSFHVPKGVSVLHALTGDGRILEALRVAIDATMQELESNTHTRVRLPGPDGKPRSEDRHTGELVWASFTHFTARPVAGLPDPHLHTHCFVFNATHDPIEERWKAAQFRPVVRDHPYFQAAFHTRLAAELERLGYRVERRADGWDLAGTTRELVDKYSRRTAEIEAAAKRLGVIDPEEKGQLGARTRSAKGKAMDAAALAEAWRAKLSPEESAWLDRTAAIASPETPETERRRLETPETRGMASMKGREAVSAAAALDWAIEHVFARKSVESERRIMAEALKYGLGDVQPETLLRELRSRSELLSKTEQGERLVTTREVLAEERAVLDFAVRGKGVLRPLGAGLGGREGEPYAIGSGAAREGVTLNDRQIKAVEQLIASRDRVQILRGGAGTGKTTLLKEAAVAIAHGGRSVHAFAVTADASRGVLREAGFAKAETLQKLQTDPKVQDTARGQVLWIDEAGMVGTPTMKRLFEVAERIDARVILAGDTKQHAPVERGDALRLLERQAGVRPAEVTEIVRQSGLYKQAVSAMETGDLVKSVDLLDRMGAIVERTPTAADREADPSGVKSRHEHLAARYLETVRSNASALIVSPTHAEGKQVTEAVRAALKEAGRLETEDRSYTRLRDQQWTDAEKADAVNYEPGMVVQFNQHVRGAPKHGVKPAPAGLKAKVIAVDRDKGMITTEDAAGERRPLPMKATDRFTVFKEESLGIATGDLVRITRNGRTLDGKHRLNNGATYRVRGFTDEGHLVLDNKGQWTVSRHFGHLAHGYCTTPQAAQGKSVDVCLAAMSSESASMSTLEQMYVVLSRGKQRVELVTDKRSALINAIGRLSQRRSAVEVMQGESAPPATPSPAEQLRRHGLEVQRLKSIEHTRRVNERAMSRSASIHQPPRDKSIGREQPKRGDRRRPPRDRGGIERER